MMKQGKYIGSAPPYGYKMHEAESHKMAIDDEASKIVRFIFDKAIEGKRTKEIANILNDDDVEIPMVYLQRTSEVYSKRLGLQRENAAWTHQTVLRILNNYTYTGALVSHRRKKASLQSKKTIKQEPIIVENTHEAIVTKEEFEQAKLVIIKYKKIESKTQHSYPLRGIVKCGKCGYSMTRERRKYDNLFICRHTNVHGKENTSRDKITEKEIERSVLKQLNAHILTLKNNATCNVEPKKIAIDNSQKIAFIKEKINQLKNFKMKIYEKFKQEIITESEFINKKNIANEELNGLNKELEELENKKFDMELTKNKIEPLNNLAISMSNEDNLSCEMVDNFINSVIVHDKDNIEVKFKFQDIES